LLKRGIENKGKGLGDALDLFTDGPIAMNGKCPRCGSKGRGCRVVPAGLWCQQVGLVEDRSRWLRVDVEPDPAFKDPAVVEAAKEANEAEAAHASALAAWENLLEEISRSGVADSINGPTMWIPNLGPRAEMRFTSRGGLVGDEILPRRDRKLIKKYTEQLQDATAAKDNTHERLVTANDRFRVALRDAKYRHAETPPPAEAEESSTTPPRLSPAARQAGPYTIVRPEQE
jgi:hypothetical protein